MSGKTIEFGARALTAGLLAAFVAGGGLVFVFGGSVSRRPASHLAASPGGQEELREIRGAITELKRMINDLERADADRIPLEAPDDSREALPSLTPEDIRELKLTAAELERALRSLLPVQPLMGQNARAVDYAALERFLAATGEDLAVARDELSLLTVTQLIDKFGDPSQVEMVNGLLRLQWCWEGQGFVACELAQGYVVNSQFWSPGPADDSGR